MIVDIPFQLLEKSPKILTAALAMPSPTISAVAENATVDPPHEPSNIPMNVAVKTNITTVTPLTRR
jgi:hypothetical protein